MRISVEVNELPEVDLDQWNKASQQKWEQLFLKEQSLYQSRESKEDHSLPDKMGQDYNANSDEDLSYQSTAASIIQSDGTSIDAVARQLGSTDKYASRHGTNLFMESTNSLHLAQTMVSNKMDEVAKNFSSTRAATASPKHVYEYSRGLLQKDQSGEATLWAGNVSEVLLRKSLSAIKRFLEFFSIRLTRVFFRGEEIKMDGASYQFEDNAKNNKSRIKDD